MKKIALKVILYAALATQSSCVQLGFPYNSGRRWHDVNGVRGPLIHWTGPSFQSDDKDVKISGIFYKDVVHKLRIYFKNSSKEIIFLSPSSVTIRSEAKQVALPVLPEEINDGSSRKSLDGKSNLEVAIPPNGYVELSYSVDASQLTSFWDISPQPNIRDLRLSIFGLRTKEKNIDGTEFLIRSDRE